MGKKKQQIKALDLYYQCPGCGIETLVWRRILGENDMPVVNLMLDPRKNGIASMAFECKNPNCDIIDTALISRLKELPGG